MSNFNEVSKTINNLSYKYVRTFTYNSNKVSDIFTFPKLNLNRDYIYTLKLDAFYGWENFINITNENNTFTYSADSGVTWKNIIIPKGVWNIKDINNKMHEIMKANKHYNSSNTTYYINIYPDKNEYKIIIDITNNTYKINFNVQNSIHKIFGFNKVTLNKGTHQGTNVPDIASSQTMLIIIDLIQPNVLRTKDGITNQVQYVRSIPIFSKPFGSKIAIHDAFPNKFKLLETAYDVDYCTIKLVDENLKPLQTAGDEFTIIFTIESA